MLHEDNGALRGTGEYPAEPKIAPPFAGRATIAGNIYHESEGQTKSEPLRSSWTLPTGEEAYVRHNIGITERMEKLNLAWASDCSLLYVRCDGPGDAMLYLGGEPAIPVRAGRLALFEPLDSSAWAARCESGSAKLHIMAVPRNA